MRPNICGAVMAFGFIFQMFVFVPICVSAPASVSAMAVFPAPVGPTSMIPCLTWYVSYSCTHFASQLGCSCRPFLVATSRIAASTSGNTALSASMPGKMSPMRDLNRGTSSATNLDMFMSRSVRIARYSSDFFGSLFARFVAPIVRKTLRMFRKPKS